MNENENNFESLRQLLALKRHETPPPGYFGGFSRDVMARIRAGEDSRTANVSSQLPWLFRLISTFEVKPAFAGGFASALCLLLLLGIVYAERPDGASQQLLQAAEISSSLAVAPSPSFINQMPAEQPAAQLLPASSTNPVFNAQPAAWFGSPDATVQQVLLRLQ
jgi:hypothetical protein